LLSQGQAVRRHREKDQQNQLPRDNHVTVDNVVEFPELVDNVEKIPRSADSAKLLLRASDAVKQDSSGDDDLEDSREGRALARGFLFRAARLNQAQFFFGPWWTSCARSSALVAFRKVTETERFFLHCPAA
jgi:hypothetical protein